MSSETPTERHEKEAEIARRDLLLIPFLLLYKWIVVVVFFAYKAIRLQGLFYGPLHVFRCLQTAAAA